MKAFLFAIAFASATLIVASSAPSSAAVQTENLRGTIVSSTADSLVVKTATGNVTVHLGPKVAYAGAVAGTTADIAPGKFLGIASVPGGALNRALEVVVFDDSMKGVGEGDYAWDLAATRGKTAMTNGTVAPGKPHSVMTNATVGAASGTVQKTITMNYKGGSRKLVVPSNAPVVKVAPGTSALLVTGASVFVIAAKAATPDAGFVVVGKDGVKLPM